MKLREQVPSINKTDLTSFSGETIRRNENDNTKHVTEDYGVLYYNSMLDLVIDKFASGKKRSNSGIVICFNKDKITKFESRFGEKEDAKVKIQLRRRVSSDGSDYGDDNMGGDTNSKLSKTEQCGDDDRTNSNSSNKTTTHPPLLASPASLASPNREPTTKIKFIKCPKETCRFENIHLDTVIHHMRHSKDHDLSLMARLEGGEAIIAKELGMRNKIKLVEQISTEDPKSYNGILILDVNETQSGSPYKRHDYGCTECNFKSWVYDDTFQHIVREHLQVCVELEYLKNEDYVEALKTLDNSVDMMRSFPTFWSFLLGIAREIFCEIQFNESEIL